MRKSKMRLAVSIRIILLNIVVSITSSSHAQTEEYHPFSEHETRLPFGDSPNSFYNEPDPFRTMNDEEDDWWGPPPPENEDIIDPGGNAPISESYLTLIFLALAYGGYIYKSNSKKRRKSTFTTP